MRLVLNSSICYFLLVFFYDYYYLFNFFFFFLRFQKYELKAQVVMNQTFEKLFKIKLATQLIIKISENTEQLRFGVILALLSS